MHDSIKKDMLNAIGATQPVSGINIKLHNGDPGTDGTLNQVATAGGSQNIVFAAATGNQRTFEADVKVVNANVTVTHATAHNTDGFLFSFDIVDKTLSSTDSLHLTHNISIS